MTTERERPFSNYELAEIFDRIANLLEIKGEVIYKTLAYRRAAESLRALPDDISSLQAEGRLQEVPGVGKAIAEKIDELLTSGRLGFLERLEQEVPPTLVELLQVPGVGPKKVNLFWKWAGITTLAELENAARQASLRKVPGIGEKSEARILAGIEALSRRSQRMLLVDARLIARRWLQFLRSIPGTEQVETAGSLRRWRQTIGDIDLVAATSDPQALMQAFTGSAEVLRVLGQGENKSSVELHNGVKLQLWAQPPDHFGSLYQFVTGSKDHNVRLRELAQRKGLSLSERGLMNGNGELRSYASEEQLYEELEMDWIPPELREDRGEIRAARERRLPKLVAADDLRAELHSHSTWSDGIASIETMARAALQHGLKVLAITDHSGSLGIANGLSVERLRAQRAEIDRIQSKLGDSIRLLQGSEIEIRADGSLDYPDEILAKLDVVIASLHSSLRQPREVVTARLLNAIRNPHVDIIGHPSGQLLPDREGADLDWEAVLPAAQESRVALEINANPERMDLDEIRSRRAVELGIPLCINTDAHAPDNFELLEYGVAVARRAWVGPESVINAWPVERLLSWLEKR